MTSDHNFRLFSLTTILLWLLIFAILPFSLIVVVSFMSHDESQLLSLPFTWHNYANLLKPSYLKIFEKSLILAALTTIFCLMLGYPFAYMIARMSARYKNILMLLIIIPFWTSSLIRSYALIALIKAKGIINSLLLALGIIKIPIAILFTNYAVIIGLVYNLLPFMILPIMTNIERLDTRLVDAARDLGANTITTFSRVIIPLTIPGIIAGCIMVFLPAMTLFYIPDILGGAKSILLGNLIQNQFLIAQNWPLGSAFSTVLTILLGALIITHMVATRYDGKRDWL